MTCRHAKSVLTVMLGRYPQLQAHYQGLSADVLAQHMSLEQAFEVLLATPIRNALDQEPVRMHCCEYRLACSTIIILKYY